MKFLYFVVPYVKSLFQNCPENERIMTESEKEEYKNLLISEIEKAKQVAEELSEASEAISPDNAIGRVSRMDAIGNKAVNDVAFQHAKDKLEALEMHLSNYGGFMFGCCESCSRDISFKRLMAMPEVNTCMICASS